MYLRQSFKNFLKVVKFTLPIDLVCIILSYFIITFSVDKLYSYYSEINSFQPLIESLSKNIENLDLTSLNQAIGAINQSLGKMYAVIFFMFLLLFLLYSLSQSLNWKISSDRGVKVLFKGYNNYFWNFTLLSLLFLVCPLLLLGPLLLKHMIIAFLIYFILIYFAEVGYGLLKDKRGMELFRGIFTEGIKNFKTFGTAYFLLFIMIIVFGALFFWMMNYVNFLIAGIVFIILVCLSYSYFRVVLTLEK